MFHYLIVTFMTILLGIGQAWADKGLAELYFSDKNPNLTKQEKQALAIAKDRKSTRLNSSHT